MDPRIGPVTVQLGGTAAQLLAKLAAELGTEDAGGLLSRALGLLEMAVHARRMGQRLVLYDEKSGRMQDVAV